MSETIYMPLEDEGVRVRRPAPAYRLPNGRFIVLRPEDYDATLETWAFPPGSIVECEPQAGAEGEVLTAVRGVAEQDSAQGKQAV